MFGRKPKIKRTIDEVCGNLIKTHSNRITLLNDTLPKYKEKLSLHCNICGNTFYATYDNLINKGSGCPYCAKHIKTTEEFVSELKSIFGNKLTYDKVQYVNARTPVTLICPKHGDFNKTPNKLLCGQGCPKCKQSRLESIIAYHLSLQKIEFEEQKRFEWLGNQSLDFYLPKYNMAIECQGEQHFHQVFFNGKSTNIEPRNLFENIKNRDEMKSSLCKNNNIELLYFIDNKVPLEKVNNIPLYKGNYFFTTEDLISKIIKQ